MRNGDCSLMVLGVRNDQEMATTPAPAPEVLNAQASASMNAFNSRHGSLLCRELTGCNMSTTEGMEQFKNREVKHAPCHKLISSAVKLLQAYTQFTLSGFLGGTRRYLYLGSPSMSPPRTT